MKKKPKAIKPELPFLQGAQVVLRPLGPADATEAYLSWLNDPSVLRYRTPKAYPTTRSQLKSWIEGLPARGDLVLAIRLKSGDRHIGNISLNSIQWVHRSAELSIMIGATDVWSKGAGTEAIRLLSAHGFNSMGLHRLWAESPNPAFNKVMQKLGWTREGVKREAFLLDGQHVDFVCWSLLAKENRKRAGARRR